MFIPDDEKSSPETCRSYGAFREESGGIFLFYKHATPTELNVTAQVEIFQYDQKHNLCCYLVYSWLNGGISE